ncbi:MAG TPA: putative glycolipid-binding domain-containing protein [Candidatus Dormibacteraeota bacterium]|nr:putative glycolipid-binding domain-containing protein [Candidatus Dormibacteraeota bacterium]
MGPRRWILWQGLITPSMERFIVGSSDVGFEFSGLILQAHEESPYVVRYAIEVDAGWRTRKVEVEIEDGGQRRLSLTVDGAGNWSHEGHRLEQVAGCIDVDLEWSPSTNTLPIRRLGLAPGKSKTVTAAWVRFPSLDVERLEQSYECLAERRYRYRSGRFTADLAVDVDGMVLQYGVNWKAVATSGELA